MSAQVIAKLRPCTNPNCVNGMWKNRRGYKCFTCNGRGVLVDQQSQEAAKPVESPVFKTVEARVNTEMLRKAFDSAQAAHIPAPRMEFELLTFKWHHKGIMVIDPKAQYPDNLIGWIRGNTFTPNFRWKETLYPELTRILDNLQAEAVAYGQKTRRCSICGISLTNPLSVRLGIGPICRGKMGWVAEETTLDEKSFILDLDLDPNEILGLE